MYCTSDKRVPGICSIILSASLVLLLSLSSSAADAPCGTCHYQTVQSHATAPHGKADVSCASCHGDDQAHIKSPNATNIRSFSHEPVAEQTAVCTSCHGDKHGEEPSAHSAAGLSCGSCHSIHVEGTNVSSSAGLPVEYERLPPGSSVCFDCHQETFAQFEFNERHRLIEGVVTCASCHDPHSPRLGAELGGFTQSACGECHADVEGPFVFEHAASRIEGCAACHEPHGSPNRHMLKIQEVGALCYSCHADVPQFHVGFAPAGPPRFDESTVCTNCHVTIHGSNLDRLFLR